MRINLTIYIIVLAEKATGASKVVYFSDYVPAGKCLDLFVSETDKLIALFHPQAFDEPQLKARREQNAMIYPGSKTNQRMIFVGQVCGALQEIKDSYIEISRAPLRLKNIPLDEQ